MDNVCTFAAVLARSQFAHRRRHESANEISDEGRHESADEGFDEGDEIGDAGYDEEEVQMGVLGSELALALRADEQKPMLHSSQRAGKTRAS